MIDAFRLSQDSQGRIEYWTLAGLFVAIDLRTTEQRVSERQAAINAGTLDQWIEGEMQWLKDCGRSVIHDKFVVPNTTSGGPG